MIVDDEPAIVEGLAYMFQEQEKLEVDIVKAYSAFEAIEIARKTKIDILLSDIRMPEKSGLQLLDEISFYWPSCRVIFLTGFSDFENLYTAVSKNVEGFILKTEEEQVVIKKVKETMCKLDEQVRSKNTLEAALGRMKRMEPLVKKEAIEALLLGEDIGVFRAAPWFTSELISLNPQEPVLLLAGKLDRSWEEQTTADVLSRLYAVRSLFAEHLPPVLLEEGIIHENTLLVWLIQPQSDTTRFREADGSTDWRGMVAYLKGVLENVQNTSRDDADIDVSFILSGEALPWEGICERFEKMKSLFKRLNLRQAIFEHDGENGDPASINPAHPQPPYDSNRYRQHLKRLEQGLVEGDEAIVVSACRDAIQGLKQDHLRHPLAAMERYYSLVLIFLSAMNSLETENLAMDEQFALSASWEDASMDWGELERRFFGLGSRICLMKREYMANGELRLLQSIHRYIDEHIGSDLSLVRIAEVVHFNPSYLSRYYKQLAGRNLSEYINEAKAEAAALMLVDPNCKIYEVGIKLGFESPSYFTAFFRKMKGVSPQEYRAGSMK